MNELDEIEAELGKERTLKVGDKVKMPSGQEGIIKERCRDCGPGYWLVEFAATDRLCQKEDRLIPVEPERVKGYYRMSCATRSCAANDEGMCNVSINGLATCSKHQWPKPSPGLLQRMGMAWELKGWFVVRLGPQGGAVIALASATEMEAQEWLKRDATYRAFRWQDGVR